MTSLKRLLTVSLLLLLTACGDAGIAALGALGSSAMAYGTKVVIQDTEDAAIWRNEHRMVVGRCEEKLMQRIEDLTTKDFNKILERCERLLEFSADQQPQIFLERMQGRIDRVKAKSETKK